jgi:type IV pilus assembly protein PilX
MTAPTSNVTAFAPQRGAVLFVSLIFLLVLTLLGVMLARSQTTEERMAQNDSNHDLAVEAAGAALRFAELNIRSGIYSNFGQNNAGLYLPDPTTVGSVYTPAIWGTPGAVLPYTGTALTSVPTAPQFIIEELTPTAMSGTPLTTVCSYGGGNSDCVNVYQITANAYGGDKTANATLRSIYVQEQ